MASDLEMNSLRKTSFQGLPDLVDLVWPELCSFKRLWMSLVEPT